MKKIAHLILWITWNTASILAFPIYALKYELRAIIGCVKEWREERKKLKGYLMPKKEEKPAPTETN